VAELTAVQVFSDAEAAANFGAGSMLHRMVRAAIRAYAYIDITCIALDDAAAGVAATATTTITGPATGSGVVTLRVGTDLVQVAVESADTATEIAAALKAQADQQPDLPVTVTAAAGVLTITARHKGAQGNSIKLSASSTATSVTAVATAMAGGQVDPAIANLLALVADAGHNLLITPYPVQSSLLELREHLEFVGGALEQRGASGVYALVGTLAQATTLAGAVNCGRITGAAINGVYRLPWEVAAGAGAVVASEEDPARPLNGLPIKGMDVPDTGFRWTRTEQEVLLKNGVMPLEVGADGTSVQIVRAITTYTKDGQGIQDVSLLDLTTIRTLDYTRKAVRTRLALRFPREKLTARTEAAVRGEVLDVLFKLEALEIIENVAANAEFLIVERDLQDANRLNIRIPVDVVNGLHVIAGVIDLYL
jgi:phage tail sheath gpL-like